MKDFFRRLFRIKPPCPHTTITGLEIRHYLGAAPEAVLYCREGAHPVKFKLRGLSDGAGPKAVGTAVALILLKNGYREAKGDTYTKEPA